MYWKPALAVKEGGKPRWGAAPEVALNLLPSPDFPRQRVLPLPHNLSLPGERLISQDLNLCHFQQSSPLICSLASSRMAEPVPLLRGLCWHPWVLQTAVAGMLRLIQRVHHRTVKPPPVPPEHVAEFSWGCREPWRSLPVSKTHADDTEWIRAVVQPVFLTHPNFPRGLLWG